MININEGNVNSAKNQMRRWGQCRHLEITHCFEHYNEITSQYERFTGIEYGEIDPLFMEFIRAASLEQKDSDERTMYINMCLGIYKREGQSDCINILFETFKSGDNSETNYYESSGVQGKLQQPNMLTLRNSAKYIPQEPVGSTEGLDPIVKEHLCTAWCFTSPSDIPKLFMAQMTAAAFEERSMTKPLSRQLSRGLKFAITGRNLDVMASLLQKKDQKAKLSIRFGVNTSDIYYDDVTFSPIIEISSPQMDSTSSERSVSLDMCWEDKNKKLVKLTMNPGANQAVWHVDLNTCKKKEGPDTTYLYDIQLYNMRQVLEINTADIPDSKAVGTNASLVKKHLSVPIVENSVQEITDLDFVHACPPFCDP